MATTFRIIVQVDSKRATAGVRRVEKSLLSLNAVANKTRAIIGRAFTAFAITAAVRRGINVLADFGQAMSTVQAVTRGTAPELAKLRAEAQRLGATTRFTATQAAEGMVFLARAGFTTQEVLDSVEGTLTLAQSGALELARASELTANIIRGFGLEASEAARVVDIMSLAANSSDTNVQQLGKALSFVAPAASNLGISIEETTAALGRLGDAGIKGTRGGTGLRTLLIKLDDAGGALSIRAHGLTAVLERLRNANITLADATRLVGLRQSSTLLALVKGTEVVKDLDASLQNAAGAAAEAARIMDDNLRGAMFATASALEAVILALGEAGLTDALISFFRGLTENLRFVAANIDTFIKVVNVLATTLGVALARRAIPAAILAVRALGVAILANPLGFLVTAVATAISILINFEDELRSVHKGFGLLIDAVKAAGRLIVRVVGFIVDVVHQAAVALGIISEAGEETREEIKKTGDEVEQLQPKLVRTQEVAKITADGIQKSFNDVDIKNPFDDQLFDVENSLMRLEDTSSRVASNVSNNISRATSGATTPAATGSRSPQRSTFSAPGDITRQAERLGADIFTSLQGGIPSQGLTINFGLTPSDETRLRRQELAARARAAGVSTNGLPGVPEGPLGIGPRTFNDFDLLFGRALTTPALDAFEKSVVAAEEAIRMEAETRARATAAFDQTFEQLARNVATQTGADALADLAPEQRTLIDQIAGLEKELVSTNELTKRINLGIRIDKLRESLDSAVDANRQLVQTLTGNVFERFRQDVFGFRNGGGFRVPGTGAPDSKFVPLRLTPGEEVSIKTQAQQRRGDDRGGDTIIKNETTFNVTTKDADSFRRSQKQITGSFIRELESVQRRF